MNYKFEITDLRSYITQYSCDVSLVIKILSLNISKPLYIHIKVKSDNNVLIVENMRLEVCPTWNKDEQLAFISGAFDFKEDIKDYIDIALKGLEKDNNTYCLPSKWRFLAYQFRDWYKVSIKPLLDKELESFKSLNNGQI